MSAFHEFRVGDRVKSLALGIGRVTRITADTIHVTYRTEGGRTLSGFYSRHWFLNHPANMEKMDGPKWERVHGLAYDVVAR